MNLTSNSNDEYVPVVVTPLPASEVGARRIVAAVAEASVFAVVALEEPLDLQTW